MYSLSVSIIIVNYNTKHLLKQCLDSIYHFVLGVSFEIIVVDNDSSDGSVEFLREFYPGVFVIPMGGNVGFGRANNKAVEVAVGRYLFFLNTDTIMLNDAVSELFNFMEKNIDVGVCGGNLYNKNLGPVESFSYFPSIYKDLLFLFPYVNRLFSHNFNHSNDALEVDYIVGADLMLRRDVLRDDFVFDPNFFMYYEETDLCLRVKKMGYLVKSIPSARIVHLVGSSSVCSVRKSRIIHNSKYYYYRKNFSIYAMIFSRIIDLFNYAFRMSLSLVFFDKRRIGHYRNIILSIF